LEINKVDGYEVDGCWLLVMKLRVVGFEVVGCWF
jgi:hypothetical protein